MGRVAVENAVKIIRGETPAPDVNVKLELVTKDTVK
jgi:ABC-type sugar transport system substrate-binding protein